MSTDPKAWSNTRLAPRVRSRRTRIVAVAGLITLLAGTAACGDDDDSADNSLPGAIVGTSDMADSTALSGSPSTTTRGVAATTAAATATTRAPTGATTTTAGADAGGSGDPIATVAGATPGSSDSAALAATAGAGSTPDGSTPDDSAPVSTTAECEDYQTNVQYPLEKCDTGYVIVLVQSVLKNFGYYDGEVSGDFDNATEESLRDYQEAMQLDVDGLVGSQTWKRMLPDLDAAGTDNNGNGVIDPFEVVAG